MDAAAAAPAPVIKRQRKARAVPKVSLQPSSKRVQMGGRRHANRLRLSETTHMVPRSKASPRGRRHLRR